MSNSTTKRQSILFKNKKKTDDERLEEILQKNRLINRQQPYIPPSESDEEINSSEEYTISPTTSSSSSDDDDDTEPLTQQEQPLSTEIPPVVIVPDLKMFWVGCLLGMIIAIAMNMLCIWFIVTSWNRTNNANDLIHSINLNLTNASINTDDGCLSCSGSTSYINGIMHTDVNSELLPQFSLNGGIIIDNIIFEPENTYSSNINTSILFENNMEASNMLVSKQPGFISIPLETSSQLTTIGACPSSNLLVPSIYAYKSLMLIDQYYICFCGSTNKYCSILTQTS